MAFSGAATLDILDLKFSPIHLVLIVEFFSYLCYFSVPSSGFMVVTIPLIAVLVAAEYLHLAGGAELGAVTGFSWMSAYWLNNYRQPYEHLLSCLGLIDS